MLPSKLRITRILQEKLGPSKVVLWFLDKLRQKIETNAAKGVTTAELYIPPSVYGKPSYDRKLVAEQILFHCLEEKYDAELGEHDWTIRVSFELSDQAKIYMPKINVL